MGLDGMIMLCVFSLHIFSYIIENGVCYLTLTEKTFSKRAAFSFLEDLSNQFWREYGDKVRTAVRPYSFIEFGKDLKSYYICHSHMALATHKMELMFLEHLVFIE